MEGSLELMLIVHCIYMYIYIYMYYGVSHSQCVADFFRISRRESNTIEKAHDGTRLRNNNTVFIIFLFFRYVMYEYINN